MTEMKVKKKQKAKKRRNASSGAAIAVPPRGGGRSKKANSSLKTMGVAVAGGVAGAMAAGIAVSAGVKPQTAAIATLAGGAVGAYALKGNAKVAALGAACAASGQLALAWQIRRQAEQALKAEEKRKEAQAALPAATQPALPTGASGAGSTAKRNGYDDDGSDDLRNAGEVEEYAYTGG